MASDDATARVIVSFPVNTTVLPASDPGADDDEDDDDDEEEDEEPPPPPPSLLKFPSQAGHRWICWANQPHLGHALLILAPLPFSSPWGNTGARSGGKVRGKRSGGQRRDKVQASRSNSPGWHRVAKR